MSDPFASVTSYSLELFQRDVLGLSDETMIFNESTLANALLTHIENLRIDADDAFMLKSFVHALANNETSWRLTLKGARRGPRQLIHEKIERTANITVLHSFVGLKLDEGLQAKAAVSLASEFFGISKATVYRQLREYKAETVRLEAAVERFSRSLAD